LSDLVVGWWILLGVSEAIRDFGDDLCEQVLRDAQAAAAVGVDEGVLFAKELGDGRATGGIAVEAVAEGGFETRGYAYVADTVVWVMNGIVAVDDGKDTRHLVGDVGEGRLAVDHLVEDAAQTPDIARLAELHIFGAVAVGEKAAGAARAVFKTLRRHVVWCTDVRVAVNVDGMVDFDGVGDAEVDELETPLDKHEIGGFKIGVYYVMVVHGAHAFKHFFPVVPREAKVKLCIGGIELHADDPSKI